MTNLNTAVLAAEVYNDLSKQAREFIDCAFDSTKDPTPYENEIDQSVYDYAANESDGLNADHLCNWLRDDPASFDYMEEVVNEGLVSTSQGYSFYYHVCFAIQRQVENDIFEDMEDIKRWYLFASVAARYPEIPEDAADDLNDTDLDSCDSWSQLRDKAEEIINAYLEDEE